MTINPLWLTESMQDMCNRLNTPKEETMPVTERAGTGYVQSWYERRTGETEWRHVVRNYEGKP